MKYSVISNFQKMSFMFSFLMASLSIFSCSNKQKNLQNTVTSEPIITLEKERTRGDRAPRYKVELFDKKVVKYTGLANVSVIGERLIELKKQDYKALLKQFTASDFKSFQSSYKGKMRDLPLTSITFNNHKVTYQADICPDKLSELAALMENLKVEE